jgi:hypothetical protein
MLHQKKCPCALSINKQIPIFLPFLKKISKAKTLDQKKKIFEEAPDCLTEFIAHCSSAILRGDIELPPKDYQKLKEHKKLLLKLSNRNKSLKHKVKTFLNKAGGAFPLIPILGSILANFGIPFLVDTIKNV